MRYFVLYVISMVVFNTSCQHAEHQHDEVTLAVSSPIHTDTLINKEYVCQIRSIQHIELRAIEKGYLQKIYVDEGQSVKKGQLLFQIMTIVYQAEAQKAQAELATTEIEYRNTKALADSNIVSKNELALAKAKMQKAKAELELANAHLGFTEIRAPFDGIIGRFNDIRLGSLLDEGELLTTLSDNSKLWVYFNVTEVEYLSFASHAKKEGQPKVKLLMANNEIAPYEGTIETIGSDFNNETGNIAFRATFPNPERLLRHGQTGTILMPSFLKNALIIPQAVTFDILDKKYVYVVDGKGVIKAQPITVGIEIPHLYTINNGLTTNDTILVDGLRKVKNGEKIKTKFTPFYKVLNELTQLHAE